MKRSSIFWFSVFGCVLTTVVYVGWVLVDSSLPYLHAAVGTGFVIRSVDERDATNIHDVLDGALSTICDWNGLGPRLLFLGIGVTFWLLAAAGMLRYCSLGNGDAKWAFSLRILVCIGVVALPLCIAGWHDRVVWSGCRWRVLQQIEVFKTWTTELLAHSPEKSFSLEGLGRLQPAEGERRWYLFRQSKGWTRYPAAEGPGFWVATTVQDVVIFDLATPGFALEYHPRGTSPKRIRCIGDECRRLKRSEEILPEWYLVMDE